MNLIRLTALLVFTIGVFSFGAVLFLWMREQGKGRWRLGSDAPAPKDPRLNLPTGLLLLTCFVWFAVNLLLEVAPLHPIIPEVPLHIASWMLSFLFPPLIMHCAYVEAGRTSRTPLSSRWKIALVFVWISSQSISLLALIAILNFIDVTGDVGTGIVVALAALFVIASIYSVLLGSKGRVREETEEARRSRLSITWLFGLMGILFLVLVVSQFVSFPFGQLLSVALRSLPLLFLFVSIYFEDRYEFFDLFVKRGLALLLTVVILTVYFGLTLPWLTGLDLHYARAWVYALALLPIALALPWFYGKLGEWLDSAWLGRLYTPVEAVKHFLSGLQSVSSEEELVERAETGIAQVFQAPARIEIAPASTALPGFEPTLEVPIRSLKHRTGRIRMGRRQNHVPYFNEDVTLLTSLADVFAYMLENSRLQREKQEQQRRARELSLDASRSELKALRAQINPHFLFNALNAIAGLIHKDPLRADKTVEQLAEVFRYTLRRSENEWVALEEEMDFVRAYLEVEQARFGRRLEFDLKVHEGTEKLKIPTMMLQTLVENAVKHGVAAVRGRGEIRIEARRKEDRLCIDVADNGPGFTVREESRYLATPGKPSGYGLKNVRERLEGYFGDRATLEWRRESARQLTVVSIVMPAIVQAVGAGNPGTQGRLGGGGGSP